ncbi:hypothetical protein J1B50_004412 [Escherichia coli]|nr:hypothetical protein [Escherichia coli]
MNINIKYHYLFFVYCAIVIISSSSCSSSVFSNACDSQYENAKSYIAAKEYDKYLSMRQDVLSNCSLSGTKDAQGLDRELTQYMENNKQYQYFIARESYDFESSTNKDYYSYLDKQYQWYLLLANSMGSSKKDKSIKIMDAYNNEVNRYYREVGRPYAEYLLAKSYVEQYKFGERSPELLMKISSSLNISPYGTGFMYEVAKELAKENNKPNLLATLPLQWQKLDSAWGDTPVEKRPFIKDKSKFISVADKLKGKNNSQQRISILQLAGIRDKVNENNIAFAEKNRRIAEQQERSNAEFERNNQLENQKILESITGAAIGVASSIAGGSGVAESTLNGASAVVSSSSSNPEMISSLNSVVGSMINSSNNSNSIIQSKSLEKTGSAVGCDKSTVAGFQNCCLSKLHGSISTVPNNEDGSVLYVCTDTAGIKSGCIYVGTRLKNNAACAIKD